MQPSVLEALQHLEEQLNWVGPSGKVQGIITLPRQLAIAVHDTLTNLKEAQKAGLK